MQSVPQFAMVSKFRMSPSSHSATTSNGRQQTSQSVVKRCRDRLVSTVISLNCPQKGHATVSDVSMPELNRDVKGYQNFAIIFQGTHFAKANAMAEFLSQFAMDLWLW
jgi:hypothetical protein